MTSKVGELETLFRYPVKSMGGEPLDRAELGWHGLEGDRRLALRRQGDRGGFPWLTATKLPELILFTPTIRAALRATRTARSRMRTRSRPHVRRRVCQGH